MQKKVAMICLCLVLVLSCSSLSLPITPNLDEVRLRPCEDDESLRPVGKFCAKTCIQKKFLSKQCKTWKIFIYDFSEPETFKKFRDKGMRLEKEKQDFFGI